MVRLGIRGFNPKLKKAAERLEGLRTPEGERIPPNTLSELHRDMERRRLLRDQIRQIESARRDRLEHAPGEGAHAMVRLLARVMGIGIETADMLVHEVLLRNLRDRRAVARYAGLTGSPDESGKKRREKGLARSGNPRVRHGMIQLAWRFLLFQKDSALAQWFRVRTENARATRKTMIVALARKLLIALWRLVREGVVPDGVILRPALSLSSWLVAGIVPGVERQALKKLAVDESVLLKLLHRWREEAEKAGYMIKRIAVAFEAGRDGFWLARWLRARDIEVHVIHTSSVAVSREHNDQEDVEGTQTVLAQPVHS